MVTRQSMHGHMTKYAWSHDTHQMMEEHASSGKLKDVEEVVIILKGILCTQRKRKTFKYQIDNKTLCTL